MNTLKDFGWRLPILVAGIIIASSGFVLCYQEKIDATQFLAMILCGAALAIIFCATISIELSDLHIPKEILTSVLKASGGMVAVYILFCFLIHHTLPTLLAVGIVGLVAIYLKLGNSLRPLDE